MFSHFDKAVRLLKKIQQDEKTDPNIKRICSDALRLIIDAKSALETCLSHAPNRGYIGYQNIEKNLEKISRMLQTCPETIQAPYSTAAQCKELLMVNVPLTLLTLSFIIPVILFAHYIIAIFVVLLVILPVYFQVNKEVIESFERGREVNPFQEVSSELARLEGMFSNTKRAHIKKDDPQADLFEEEPSPDVGL